jgi:hypothetical protein
MQGKARRPAGFYAVDKLQMSFRMHRGIFAEGDLSVPGTGISRSRPFETT